MLKTSFLVIGCLLLGTAVGVILDRTPLYSYLPSSDPELILPAPRSKAVPEGQVYPGLTGDVRDLLLEPDYLERTEGLAALLRGQGPEALDAVLSAYDSVVLDLNDTELVILGHWWGGFDPRAALAWSLKHWSLRTTKPVTDGVMREWGRIDPVEAIHAAETMSPGDVVARRWKMAVLQGWDASTIDGALSYALSMAAGPDRQWALTTVTRRRVMRDGPDVAIAWAEWLPDNDPAFKLNVFRRVAGAVADVDTDKAIAFAEKHLDGPYGRGLPMRVGMSAVLVDASLTWRWLESLPAGRDRDEGVRETYRLWLNRQRAAAKAWIPTAENDGWLDPAIPLYARSISLEAPREALTWASRINDQAKREGAMAAVARIWLRNDPVAADAWLETSDLPDELVRKIRVYRPSEEPEIPLAR